MVAQSTEQSQLFNDSKIYDKLSAIRRTYPTTQFRVFDGIGVERGRMRATGPYYQLSDINFFLYRFILMDRFG
jgi:hypothetical protein